MVDKVYLLWSSYVDKKIYVIGVLQEEKGKYTFKYTEDAVNAMKQGCFLPFNYTNGELLFDNLPFFFEQRILKGRFNQKRFGIAQTSDGGKLAYLLFGDSIRNSDNYRIVSEDKLEEHKKKL